jgi:phage virion morphogenesis protein
MAGTSLRIDYDFEQLASATDKLKGIGADLQPMMMEIAEYLHTQTREHFDNEEDPDGNAWAPLQASTMERKARQGVAVNKILHGESLHLRDTIFPFWSGEEAGVSTGPGTEAYAATHQLGDDSRNIEARPFLGLGPEDEAEIMAIVEEELSKLTTGR